MLRNSVSIFALMLVTACANVTDLSSISETSENTQEQAALIDSTPNSILESSEAKSQKPDETEKASKTAAETLNAFFKKQYDAAVARSPMTQTYLGLKSDYDKWDDPSDAAAIEEFQIEQAALTEMKSLVSYDDLNEDAKLSYRLFEYERLRDKAGFEYRNHSFVFNQMFGVQSRIPAFLINQHRIDSKEDAEAYIARLNGITEYLGGHLHNAKQRAESGIRPPLFVYDFVVNDAQNVISGLPFNGDSDSPLFSDFKEKISALDLTEDEYLDLVFQANAALIGSVEPAYQELIDWIESDRKNATTDDGVWRLPDGETYYAERLQAMTTTDLSAEEIHALGLSEVERIHAEMEAIKDQVGFDGDLQSFFEFMRTDAQFYYENTDAGREKYLSEATALIEVMKEKLPTAFNTFPKADLIVKRVEPFREKSAGKAFYQRPAADGSRPGTYYANLYNMADMPTYQMEALAYHEGIPGHHMQLAIAQELTDIPRFRKYGRYTAYTEGWGLYSEYLPKEMGFYEDPYSDFGRLAMELWRAARLVVDTGLHHKKWTREEAIQYLIDNTPNPEGDCRKAIERYIVMPGQATAYKIGMLKILEVREKARSELGDAFDIAAFHDIVLEAGPIPLHELENRIDDWISTTKTSD